jgi:uncharacterized protein involved in tolerance to divalent cations
LQNPEWLKKLPVEKIEALAKEYGLEHDLLLAICWHESRGLQWVTRYEAKTEKYVQFYNEHASQLMISSETEKLAQMHSYGLPQIMGFVVRDYGFKGYLNQLCFEPSKALQYMCIHIKKIMQRFGGEESDIIAAYNFGRPSKVNGMYVNQKYVDAVSSHLRELRKLV